MFNDWLVDQLRERDWTQADFARATGLTTAAVSKYINGRVPDADALRKIARALKLPASLVFEKAGVLPSAPPADEISQLSAFLFDQLTQENKEKALEYMRFLQEQETKGAYNAAKLRTKPKPR